MYGYLELLLKLAQTDWRNIAEADGLSIWTKREWMCIVDEMRSRPIFKRILCEECGETYYSPIHNHCDV